MKIDRLIGILSILLQQDKVTAPYLAGKFEVSRRTINRDIEDLCRAGIPLVTLQGANGGISIMEGYKLNRTLLTSSDMQAILTGLRSLDSVSGTSRYQQLMDKLAVNNQSTLATNHHILIDLSSHYKSTLAPKIELLQNAIGQKNYVQFAYFAPGGESIRVIEPYLLVFRWSSWYLWGYCAARSDYRLFKLNRMLDLIVLEETYSQRTAPKYEAELDAVFPPDIQVKAVFEPEMKWRLIEEYGVDSFVEMEDGRLLFQFGFYDEEILVRWMLSFGNGAELLEPVMSRKKLGELIKQMNGKYS